MNPILSGYARLKTLHDNLRGTSSVTEDYVREFHAIVDVLEKASKDDLNEFRVSDSWVKPRVTSISPAGRKYSVTKYCDKAFLLSKIEALLLCFELSALKTKEP